MMHMQRWRKYHRIKGLLSQPTLQRPFPELQGEALYDYNVRKILIVDQDLTVDFLVKNGFHKHHHLLIFSFNVYPNYMAQFARRILTMHDDVVVYLLHQEGLSATHVKQHLRQIGVKAQHRLIHLGFRRRDRSKISRHLGFYPRDWSSFSVDTLPPHALFEGLISSIKAESTLHPHLTSDLFTSP